jgi:hypothetical protein
MENLDKPARIESRWPALVALVGVGGLYLAIPSYLYFGPKWLLLAIILVFQVPLIVLPKPVKHKIAPVLEHSVLAIITFFMIASIDLLVHALPSHAESAKHLLFSAVALWLTNVIVFAGWYWLLDAGGPRQRELKIGHTDGALLFPQMVLSPEIRKEMGQTDWSPDFVDYLFHAFNTSTAFSPTDVPPLSRWAKVLMMLQSTVSLTIITLLAARAVNIY